MPDTREVKFFSGLWWYDLWVDMARLPVFNGLLKIMERAELDITAQLARLKLSEEEIQRFEQAVVQMRENLAQYIARPPISLKKIRFESFHGKVLFHTDYNEYFKENLKLFDASDFIALPTQHLPPKGVQYIRRYGLGAPAVLLAHSGQMVREALCCTAGSGWVEAETPRFS